MAPSLPLTMPINMIYLFCESYILLAVSDDHVCSFLLFWYFLFTGKYYNGTVCLISNWWIWPLKGGFLSTRIRCTRCSEWLYHYSTVISITMVNNKKQYFWLSFILSCGNSKKYFWLACLQTRPKIVCWLSVYAATLPPIKPVFCFEKVSQLQESAWTAILSLM